MAELISGLGLLVLVCGVGTYLWRGLGVALSGRIHTDSAIFTWVACVAYAMIAGLIARIMVMPVGILTKTLLEHRLLACAVALAVFFLFRRNLFIGVVTGGVVLVALQYGRGMLY